MGISVRGVLLLLAIACGGCSGASAVPQSPRTNAAMSAAKIARGLGTLKITLPPIAPTGAPIDWASKPQLLAPRTRTVVVTVVRQNFGPFPLSTTTSGCAQSGNGLTCTVTIRRVPAADNVGVEIRTYASMNGKGTPLAIGLLETSIPAKSLTQLTATMSGAAKRLRLLARDAFFTVGEWTDEPLIAAGIDVAGEVIPSTSVVETNGVPLPTVQVKYNGFLTGTLQIPNRNGAPTTLFACCGILPVSFPYDGLQTASETFTLTATGFTAESLTLPAVPGNVSPATLLVGNATSELSDNQSLEMFPLASSGSIPPARAVILPTSGNLYGEDSQGNFWSGGSHYTNLGQLLGSIQFPEGQVAEARDSAGNIYTFRQYPPCALFEYPAGQYGTPAPIREIDYTCAIPGGSGTSPSVAVDGVGDIYVTLNGYNPVQSIVEFAPGTASGESTPTRTILFPPNVSLPNEMPGLDVDAAGNVYAVGIQGPPNGPTETNVYEIAPGATNASPLLSNVAAATIAVDDGGDIFAWNQPAYFGGWGAIDVYPAGSSAASRTIGGAAAGIDYAGQIAVPRGWAVGTSTRRIRKP